MTAATKTQKQQRMAEHNTQHLTQNVPGKNYAKTLIKKHTADVNNKYQRNF